MTAPMIIAGTTGEDKARIYCQFWGEWKDPSNKIRVVEFAGMDNKNEVLRIRSLCPPEWYELIWAAFQQVTAGVVPAATHTIAFDRHSMAEVTPIDATGGALF